MLVVVCCWASKRFVLVLLLSTKEKRKKSHVGPKDFCHGKHENKAYRHHHPHCLSENNRKVQKKVLGAPK